MEFLPAGWVLFAIRWYGYLHEVASKGLELGTEIFSAVTGVFQPRYYVLFGSRAGIYPVNAVNVSATRGATPSWLYSPMEHLLYASVHSLYRIINPLPILSLELVDTEAKRVEYDLTDFIEKVRVQTNRHLDNSVSHEVSISDIIDIWSVHSSIVPSSTLKARVMTAAAEQITTDIYDARPLKELKEEPAAESEEDAPADQREGVTPATNPLREAA
jgi:hypothetical protein